MANKLNIMRTMRIKMKNGWIKETPPEYYFMVRYPPINGSPDALRHRQPMDIPYARFLRKAIERTPKFAAEGVYPAYWQDEPLALIFAKKQYELIQKGMEEEAAYAEAEKIVFQMEAEAFDEAANVANVVHEMGAKAPILANEDIAKQIQKWRKRLAKRPYESLDLAVQGEIDYFLQRKVLKWNEAERDRRMTDPIFCLQFEKLRAVVFPEIAQEKKRAFDDGRETFKNQQLIFLGVQNFSQLQPAMPFYYSDYVEHFNKLKEQPHLGRWTEKNREKLSRWIVDTLAMKVKLDGKSRLEMQQYLDTIRSQYFPMVKQPERAGEFELPTEAEIRAILYKNDVGYKNEDGKLYILRCYRLPVLLFPKESLLIALTADESNLNACLESEAFLLEKMNEVGLDKSVMPEILAQLQEHQRIYGSLGVQSGSAATGGIDLSVLDELLQEDDDNDKDGDSGKDSSSRKSGGIVKDASEAANDAAKLDDTADDGGDGLTIAEEAARAAAEAIDAEELSKRREKYGLIPKTNYDKEKNLHFERMEAFSWSTATTDEDFEVITAQRTEREYVLRARCQLHYERKEAARRVKDWKKRDVIDPKELARRSTRVNLTGSRQRIPHKFN